MSVDAKKIAALELALKAKTEQLSALHKQQDAAREAIASLESERAANAILTAEIEALRAQQCQDCEPIYQYQKADGSWIDQEKHSYDYNLKNGHKGLRIVYAAPPKREPLTLEQIAKALASAGLIPEDYREDGQIEPFVRAIERAHQIGGQP